MLLKRSFFNNSFMFPFFLGEGHNTAYCVQLHVLIKGSVRHTGSNFLQKKLFSNSAYHMKEFKFHVYSQKVQQFILFPDDQI